MSRRFTETSLIVATHNRGKLEEMRALFQPYGLDVVSSGDLGLPEPEETEDSFVGNARIKAVSAMRATGRPALADDSGITIDALGGAPGVYTANWAETPAGRDFSKAMKDTWDRLNAVAAPEPRTAQFRSTLVLVWPDGHEEVFDGSISGRLVWPIRGAEGHGYDPMFQPDGYTMTFAEMSPATKNMISHRAIAFQRLIKGCFT